MHYHTVVFDLDGTLLDTLDDLADATNAALRACGYPPRSREEVRRFVGNGVHLLIERAAPHGVEEAAVERCFALFKEQYGKRMCCKTRPYSGILPLLEALREAGVQYAVVSNKYDGAVKQLSDTQFGGLMKVASGERVGVPVSLHRTVCWKRCACSAAGWKARFMPEIQMWMCKQPTMPACPALVLLGAFAAKEYWRRPVRIFLWILRSSF